MSERLPVLLIDDDEILLRSLGRVCRRAGLDVQIASNGREALELLARERFSLVLCDVRMPIVDGYAMLSALAARGPLPCPVYFLTGHSDYPEPVMLAKGASGLLKKPVPFRELQELLRRVIADTESG